MEVRSPGETERADVGASHRCPRVIRAALLGAISVVAVLTGCGGGGKPSRADYLKKANAICQTEKQEMDALALRSTGTLEEAIREAVKIRERTYAKLRAIRLPESHTTPSEWLAYRAKAIGALNELLQTRPRSAARRASNTRYFYANARAATIARAYGLTRCVGFAGS